MQHCRRRTYDAPRCRGCIRRLGIFKSGNPAKRASAIVQAVTNYTDDKLLAELSEDLGEAMVGINENEIALLMAERGK